MEHVNVERSASFSPIFQVMFVLQERALDSTRSLSEVSGYEKCYVSKRIDPRIFNMED